ncbi:MAG: N-acetylglucosamine-6-phosphate deacetylase [Candidatus Melainabacteria bacterium]|nr:N-acetylglucosamine-6-phosphate deacetylase [Candidatus Melainabacteria bacterium]
MSKATTIITGATVLGPAGPIHDACVVVEGNRISQITETPPASLLLRREDVEYVSVSSEYILTPGLIDLHINGGLGCDFSKASIPEIQQLLTELPRYGITGLAPTLVSAPEIDMVTATNTLEEVIHIRHSGHSRILGIHLEGPFLNPAFRGTHAARVLKKASLDTIKTLASPHVKLVTLAPEMDADGTVTRYLVENNIQVFAGHTQAGIEDMRAAIQHGVTGVTHLYNAMRGFHHRDPGMLAVVFNDPHLYVALIADGFHAHPEAIRLALKLKPLDTVILVSDAMALAGLAEGQSTMFCETAVTNQGGRAVNAEGQLAGSTIFLDTAVRQMNRWALAKQADIFQMASGNPAKVLHVDHELGNLVPGYLADMVLWNAISLQVEATWIDGKLVYSRQGRAQFCSDKVSA